MTHKVMHTLVTLRHENDDCGCKCWDSTPEVWNGVSFAAEAFAGLPHIQCLAMTYSMVEWYWASHADTQHSKRAGLQHGAGTIRLELTIGSGCALP